MCRFLIGWFLPCMDRHSLELWTVACLESCSWGHNYGPACCLAGFTFPYSSTDISSLAAWSKFNVQSNLSQLLPLKFWRVGITMLFPIKESLENTAFWGECLWFFGLLICLMYISFERCPSEANGDLTSFLALCFFFNWARLPLFSLRW